MIKKFFIILLGIIVFWSCEEIVVDQENPLDPGNPDYESPIVNIISGPSEGEVIDEPQVTFAWEGNEWANMYRYKIDANDWPDFDWSAETSKTFDYLDEGNHSFFVQSQYLTGDTSSVIKRTFTVDAVEGPALMFYPRMHTTSAGAVGNRVTFQIMAEEVENLTAVEFNVNFDTDKLSLVSVDQGNMLQISGESIFLTNYTVGSLNVISAALGGNQPSVDGTGVLMELTMEVINSNPGTTTLEFDGSAVFRDPDNNDITINETVGGVVVVE